MKLLLSSVFGPFGVDDAYGRKENKLEILHNQVTREQGIFSMRANYVSFGLHLLAANIEVPATVLDFPSEQRFIREIRKKYDYVGISFIVPNFAKAKRMSELVRRYAPESKIILGGYGTNIPGIESKIECDHICRGEGVRWLRRLLGEQPDRPIVHPTVISSFANRVVGVPLGDGDAAVLVPGVGCANACRFCATSHFFDKRYIPYFATGRELFDLCVRMEREAGVREFFVMDDNFLKQPRRARELADAMQESGKLFRFGIFSSAETIAEVGVEFLARMGVYFLWLGVESKREVFEKNRGRDLGAMVGELRDHGINVLTSGILFLDHHDEQTIWEDIEYVSGLKSDFVQFMGLGPMPGTRLYDEFESAGRLCKEMPYEEWHGQNQIWFRHPHFSSERSAEVLRDAFRYDYDTSGSSLLRVCDTVLRGYRTLARYHEPMMVSRREELRKVALRYRPLLPVFAKYAHNERAAALARELSAAYEAELGPVTPKQHALARVVLACAAREAKRVATGRNVYQPKTILTQFRVSWAQRLAARLGQVGSFLRLVPSAHEG